MTSKLLAGAAVTTVAGVLVWGLLAFGIARSFEDTCLHDLMEIEQPGYGSATQRGELLPPTFECTLRSSDPSAPPVVVDHHVRAWGSVLAVVAFPVVWVAAAWAVLRRLRRPRVDPAGRRPR